VCGIAGILHLNGSHVSESSLNNMSKAIAHRGPDGDAIWNEGAYGVAHRRLAILDLSQLGAQPMVSTDGNFVLAYNGELYNFLEIRSELQELGYIFKSSSDTEVILYSLIHWGEKAVKKFNGMFALSFWDRQKKELLLARDRYGIKPLYYYYKDSRFLYGSEQKAILSQNYVERILHRQSLVEYFTFQNFLGVDTLISDIQILPPGHILKISISNSSVKTHQYWDFDFQEPDEQYDVLEWEEELARLLANAVSRQLVSDVEIGSYLSGGMDSGSITALSSKCLADMKTFTVGFDLSSASGLELSFDERAKAELMSATFRTEHYEMVLKAGDMERILPQLVYHLEEPRVGQSYPNFYAAKLASRFVKVVLSGAGGDEIFAGYPWRYFSSNEMLPQDVHVGEYYKYWQRLASNAELKALFSPLGNIVEEAWTQSLFANVLKGFKGPMHSQADYLNASLYFEAKTFLHGLLIVEDKLSMAHGLETRLPFLDNDLVDFAMRCPISLKLRAFPTDIRIDENDNLSKITHRSDKSTQGKVILRNVMKAYLPEGIVEGRKQGFSSPDASWFRGQSVDYVENRFLKNKKDDLYNLLDFYEVKRILEEHKSGTRNRRLLIWSLLCFQEWTRQYLS
jgi:asparagine synthase (glutamine-hydrolysing)